MRRLLDHAHFAFGRGESGVYGAAELAPPS